MAELGEWACSSNDAIRISIQRAGTRITQGSFFNPAFTYPIFGEEEVIFGYKGLKIRLGFLEDALDSAVLITWKSQYASVGDTAADDVEAKLRPFLHCQEIVAGLESEVSPPSLTSTDTNSFTPPGDLLHTYNAGGRRFGIWSASLADPATKKLLQNLQIFVLFFIEGGTCIELDDPLWTIERWRVFFIYEIKEPRSYTFVGYSTAYRLSYIDPDSAAPSASSLLEGWPNETTPAAVASLKSRVRISQFLILPDWHRQGHGAHLYTAMTTAFTRDATISEITVEDPNESFDDLRDVCDFAALQQHHPAFLATAINPAATLSPSRAAPVPTALLLDAPALAAVRAASKLSDRQFARLLEMHLLSTIPPPHRSTARIARRAAASDPRDRAYYFWRLLVKQRLYKQNVDVLAQVEAAERVEKLEETVRAVEEDYVRLLEKIEDRRSRGDDGGAGAGVGGGVRALNGGGGRGAKRKIVEDDEDEDEEVENGGLGNGNRTGSESGEGRGGGEGSKRARVEDE